nr:hypothetical protein [Candidatus Njordarchaeota archaeon]
MDRRVVIRRNHVLVNVGPKYLIYPLNTSFIRNLDPSFIDKWMRAGWDVGSTALLELDHMTIPSYTVPENSPASCLFSGVILAWNMNKYFRFVAFTSGYYQNINEVNLRIDCWHEERHMRSAEEYMFSGSEPPNEEEVAEEEIKYVYQALGENGVKSRSAYVAAALERGKNANAVAGDVAISLLREFFEQKSANFRSNSNPIPQNNYTARMREMSIKMINNVTRFYENTLHIDPRTVFRHLLGR